MRLFAIVSIGLFLAGCAQQETGAAPEAANVPAPDPAPADPPAKEPEPAKPVHFTKREARLVDKNKALAEDPKLVEVENKINASDPLTAVSQAYFNAASRLHAMNLKHSVDIMKATDDRWPTFDEFDGMLKQSGLKLNGLYQWQMYAYDDQTGDICILEDRAEKKRQYEASGRDYPHDD